MFGARNYVKNPLEGKNYAEVNTSEMLKKKLGKLFENSDSEEETTLKTNKSYAKHYDEFRKKEILSHCK